MASIPVRLSAQLAERARKAARVQDRSLTEQVEHWARLGELLEATVSSAAVTKLKTVSHDPALRERLAEAGSPAGQARARALIARRGAPWFGTAPDEPDVIVRHARDGSQARGREVDGSFVATPATLAAAAAPRKRASRRSRR